MKAMCFFELRRETLAVLGDSLADFKEGFWLDRTKTKLALFEERAYWIPPARILHVEYIK